MKRLGWVLAAVALVRGADSSDASANFSKRFEEMKKAASKEDLYRIAWALPKGGDLHNHFVQTFQADQWFRAATGPQERKEMSITRGFGSTPAREMRGRSCGSGRSSGRRC